MYNSLAFFQQGYFFIGDAAGVYTKDGRSRLFAICVKCDQIDGLITLPEGDYLCADCTEQERADKLTELMKIAETECTIPKNRQIRKAHTLAVFHEIPT